MKKELPILFNSQMVRALLDGIKTQTRRICKQAEAAGLTRVIPDITPGWFGDGEGGVLFSCPYGKPGDRLWGRETWRIGAWNEDSGEITVDYMANKYSRREWLQVPDQYDFENYWIQCTDDCMKAGLEPDDDGQYHWKPGESPCRIRPSIHMPRWASRINLEVIDVRVERLQDISETDAIAEGIEQDDPIGSYRSLWESINSPGSWDANPWVWVIEFKLLIGHSKGITLLSGIPAHKRLHTSEENK